MSDSLSPQPANLPEDSSLEPAPNQARLEQARKQIRHAWIAGIFSTVMTLLVTIISMAVNEIAAEIGFNAWNLLDVGLMAGLTLGIFLKNRACAVAMFVYFIISKVVMLSTLNNIGSLGVAVAFGYLYFEGMRGTFTYQSILKARAAGKA